MYCLAIFDSSNYAISICNKMERKGLVFDVVNVPCKIARGGCGYCLKFPEQYTDTVISEGKKSNMPVREMYKVHAVSSNNKYERIH